jgi:hypothetical protein
MKMQNKNYALAKLCVAFNQTIALMFSSSLKKRLTAGRCQGILNISNGKDVVTGTGAWCFSGRKARLNGCQTPVRENHKQRWYLIASSNW